MFKPSFQLPERFHVAAVPVATVWTRPEAARELDQWATGSRADMEEWLERLTRDEKLALSTEDRIETQLLYGEAVIVTELEGDWAKVLIPSQPSRKHETGYPGWVPLCQLKEVDRGDWERKQFAAIKSKTAWLEDEQGEKLLCLSFMTCLPVDHIVNDKVKVLTPDGEGYLKSSTVEIYPIKQGGNRKCGPDIVKQGEAFIGLEYLWGGMSAFGFDCSGFVYAMHKASGYQIPRDSSDQANQGTEVTYGEAGPGDLLLFADEQGKGSVHHVGIYVGDGKMIHAPSTGKGIEILHLAGTRYEKELCTVRRYWEAGDVRCQERS